MHIIKNKQDGLGRSTIKIYSGISLENEVYLGCSEMHIELVNMQYVLCIYNYKNYQKIN